MSGNPLTQDGVDPRLVIGPGTEIIAGEGKICIAGRRSTPHPLHLPAAGRDVSLASGITTMLGGGTGSATGTWATTCTPGPWNIMRMLQASEGLPVNLGFMGKGNGSLARAAPRAGPGRRLRPEAARGLGHHARGHRHAASRWPTSTTSRSRSTPTRSTSAGSWTTRSPRSTGRAIHSVPHRRRRRRPRAGHHEDRRPAQRAPLQHQPDPAVHHEHDRRTPRHADGLPPPVAEDPRGRGVRREPDPGRDDRRRGRLPRPRHHQHDELRLPGHGPHRRGRSSGPGRPPTR